MTSRKQRLTVSVDRDLITAGQSAVDAGQATSVSAWVSAALEDKVRRDRKLALLAEAVATYERDFREITADEIHAQQRADREAAVIDRRTRTSKGRAASR